MPRAALPLCILLLLLALPGSVERGEAAPEADTLELLSLFPRDSPAHRADVNAIEAGINAVLEANDHRAGGHRVALIKGNSASPSSGIEHFSHCDEIGEKYAADRRFVGAIGPMSDECTTGIVPPFSQAGISVVSPSSGAIPTLTHGPPLLKNGVCALTSNNRWAIWGCKPSHFYPRGERNYALVSATIDYHGAAAAATFKQLGVKRVFMMSPYGYEEWIGKAFRQQARRQGLRIVGRAGPPTWRPGAATFRRHAHAVVRSRANGLYLLGTSEADPARRNQGLAPYLKAIRKAGFKGKIVGSFWLTQGLLAQLAPRAAEGMYYTSTRLPLAALPAEASALARRLKLEGRHALAAVYGATAATVLLRAIASSDGTRAGIRRALFRFNGRTPIGQIRIDANGDVVPAKIAIMRVRKGSLRYLGTLTVAR